MAVSKSQQKCVNKYIDKHYDRINLTVSKGKKNLIKAAAQAKGESVNAFINSSIDAKLSATASGVCPPSPADDMDVTISLEEYLLNIAGG